MPAARAASAGMAERQKAASAPSFCLTRVGLKRARVTQLLDLLLLAPDLQVLVLALAAIDGVEPTSERALRVVAHARS